MKKQADPTKAVMKHVKAAVRRIDDISRLNVKHARELRKAESSRIDANRTADVNAVSLANERAINQATILAKQVTDSAQALAIQLQSMESKLSDRILSLERSQATIAGSKGVTSPLIWVIATIVGSIIGAIVMSLLKK
jgi:hypothetical protein